jgi:hypothetical protein
MIFIDAVSHEVFCSFFLTFVSTSAKLGLLDSNGRNGMQDMKYMFKPRGQFSVW